MVGIFALGPVCGANFNPAVSLALMLNKTEDAGKMAIYMVPDGCRLLYTGRCIRGKKGRTGSAHAEGKPVLR